MNDKLNVIFPVGSGSLTGTIKGLTIGMVSGSAIFEVIIYSAVGAAIGYAVKLGLDYCKKRYDLKKKRTNRRKVLYINKK